MDKIKYICIACPIGCHLELEVDAKEVISIEGNRCKRGIDYAIDEHTDPKRMLTVTCKVDSTIVNRVPVKTSEAISKVYIDELVKDLYDLSLVTPLKLGDKIIDNYKDTGVDILVTRSLKE